MAQAAAYSFSADPRAVAPQHKQKYRQYNEEEYLPDAGNIMYDPRVVRGSTFASRVVSQVILLAATGGFGVTREE